MISTLTEKSQRAISILGNLHFWAIIAITFFLILIYHLWPWRPWNFDHSIWQWFQWLEPMYKLAQFEVSIHFVGTLFLVPIIYATIVFSWRGALLVYSLSLVGALPKMISVWSIGPLITNLIFLVLPTAAILIVTLEIAWHRKERKHFAEREAERKLYVTKMIESQENERQRIAQELHDDSIQTLLAIANRVQNIIPDDAEKPGSDEKLEEVQKRADWTKDTILQAIKELRRVSLDLRPLILDDFGLVPALGWLVSNMNDESEINTNIVIIGNKRKLSSQIEVTIFRTVREALNNIKRHSEATEAVVILEFASEYLKIMIKDNGRGFRPLQKLDKLATKGKLGLIGIRQRIDLIGGTFQIQSSPGSGTTLLIQV